MEDDARLAVVESELRRAQEDLEHLATRLAGLEEKFGSLRTSFEVLQTRVGMYAAMGAVIGGALMSVLMDAIRAYMHLP